MKCIYTKVSLLGKFFYYVVKLTRSSVLLTRLIFMALRTWWIAHDGVTRAIPHYVWLTITALFNHFVVSYSWCSQFRSHCWMKICLYKKMQIFMTKITLDLFDGKIICYQFINVNNNRVFHTVHFPSRYQTNVFSKCPISKKS